MSGQICNDQIFNSLFKINITDLNESFTFYLLVLFSEVT